MDTDIRIKPRTINDAVTGLKLTFKVGNRFNILTIEGIKEPVTNRDFFFTKDGSLDGTGCRLCRKEDKQ